MSMTSSTKKMQVPKCHCEAPNLAATCSGVMPSKFWSFTLALLVNKWFTISKLRKYTASLAQLLQYGSIQMNGKGTLIHCPGYVKACVSKWYPAILLSPTQGLSRSKANVVHVHIFNENIKVQNIVDVAEAHSIFKSQNSIFRMFNNPKISDAKSHHCSMISKTQRAGCSPYSSKKCPLRKLHEFLHFQGTCNGQKWGSPSNFTRALMSAFASLMSPRCITRKYDVWIVVDIAWCRVGHVIFHWHRACQKVSMLVLEELGWFRACKGAIIRNLCTYFRLDDCQDPVRFTC